MEPLREVSGKAIPFGRKNVDTDVIIPAKWLKTITREGLGRGAFETLRAANSIDDYPIAGIVITDIRFDNEADWLRKLGGSVWHIHRPNASGPIGESARHISEAGVAMQAGDLKINNTASFDALATLAEEALEQC